MSEPKQPPARKPYWRGYILQLFVSIVLPLTVLLLVVAFGSQTLHHDAMRSLVGDRDLKTARSAASALQQEMLHRADILRLMARSLTESGQIDTDIFPDHEIAASFDGGAAIFSPKGDFISAAAPGIDWTNLPSQARSVIQAGQSDPTFFTLPSSSGQDSYTLISVPAQGKGVLIGAIKTQQLIQSVTGDLIAGGQTTVLVIAPPAQAGGAHFDVLYRGGPVKVDEAHPTHPGFIEVLSGKSGIDYLHTSESEHVVAYTPIQPTGWGLVIEEAWEDIASPLLSTTQSAPLVIVPVLILAVFALWFGARSIVTPLQKLERQAEGLARGDFEAIREPVGGIEEIRNLQTELVDMSEKLEAAQHSLHSYIGAITAGIENERRSLARELHDDTIQTLIALNQRIQILVMNTPEDEKSKVVQLQTLIQQSMTNLRRLIRGLRPIFLEDLGLVASLEMLTREMSAGEGLAIAFSSTGGEHPLPTQTAMALYRMVQESLNNVVHHAQAAQAWVELAWGEDDLTVEIRDDGQGFDVPANPAQFADKGHFGLLGLHERAELTGAALEIRSRKGQGTAIRIHLEDKKQTTEHTEPTEM